MKTHRLYITEELKNNDKRVRYSLYDFDDSFSILYNVD